MADTRCARSDRTRVETVREWIDRAAAPLGVEAMSGSDALGRILAESVAAPVDLPRCDRAAVDGVAVRAAETVGASPYNPLSFRPVPAGPATPPLWPRRGSAAPP